MPDETLIWTDVRFDHAVAQQAATACERAARVLRETAGRRDGLARSAFADGNGPWRVLLVAEMAAIDQRSADLDTRLRGLANALLDASARATAEQSRRGTARRDLGHSGTGSVPE